MAAGKKEMFTKLALKYQTDNEYDNGISTRYCTLVVSVRSLKGVLCPIGIMTNESVSLADVQ